MSVNMEAVNCLRLEEGGIVMPSYLAIIGAIVDSKSLTNRFDVQIRLENILDEINLEPKYQDVIHAKFTITQGDEFQGLLAKPDHLMEMLSKIEMALYPVEVRFGFGLGRMLTKIGEYSYGADGPAFWHARTAIEVIQDSNDFGFANMFAVIEAEMTISPTKVALMNEVLAMRSFIKMKWTGAQQDVLLALLASDQFDPNFSRKDIANKMGITSTALVKRVKAAGLIAYLRSAKRVEAALLDCFTKLRLREER